MGYLNPGDFQFYAVVNGLAPAQLPGQSSDTASVLGMSVTPTPAVMKLVPGTPLSGTITITNQSRVPLTNLVVTRVNEGSGTQTLPISVSFTIHNPAVLPGNTTTPGQLTATYTLTATQPIAVSGKIFVTIDDDQGAPVTVELEPTIAPPTPLLTSTSLSAGVVVGTDILASFTLKNTGSAGTGPITVVSPVPWITLASLPTPIAPGQSEQVEMQLTPAEGQALGPFDGTLAVEYDNIGLSVPMAVDVVSDQHGSVQVIVDDEGTTATQAGAHLAGALVQLIDPSTGQLIASGTSTTSGLALTNITAGTYEIEVSAPQHGNYTSPIFVQPGTNTVQVFLHETTVTYNWTVVPTQVQDHYTIELQSDFVTQVPIPNLVPDKPFVMPLLDEDLPGNPGGSTVFFTENVTNQGLIAATNVQISAVSNGSFTLTPLIHSIAVLPAQSTYAIPVELSANPGVTVEVYDRGDDCCNLPELDIKYSYVASQPVEQVRQVKVDPVFVTDAHYQSIAAQWGSGTPGFGSLIADLFNAPDQAFIQYVLNDTSNPETTDPQGNPIGNDLAVLEQDLLSALANGLTGTESQVAADASALLSGLCSLTSPPSSGGGGGSGTGSLGGGGSGSGSGGYTGSTGGGVSGSGGGTGGTVTPTYTPFTWNIPTTSTAPARVRIGIEQQAVFTRDGFQGALTIDNSAISGLSDIQVHLDIETVPGPNGTAQEATDDFSIGTPQLTGFTANSDGSFSLGGAVGGQPAEGTATYTIIPTLQAAPTANIQYAVGGTLSYTEADGTVIDVPLLPAQITVEPSPDLVLNYFWQQQVEGQDALTPAVVQPSVPFTLGLQVTNIGAGAANDFSITSAQPQIVQNAQGLPVGFHIAGTTVNGQPAAPTLTADVGDIAPNGTSTAAWILTSTLAGYFENFTASYQHDNALGGAATSLIDSVQIHNLVQMVEAGYVGDPAAVPATGQPNPVPDDGVQDFLVSDLPGSLGQPDGLYLSDGTSAPVAPSSDVSVSPIGGHTYQITAFMPAGWGYLDIVDPAGGSLEISQVARPDGLDLVVPNPGEPGSASNVWETVQDITSNGFVTAENDLHLLDYNATAGTITYTVTYINPNAVTPQITSLQAVKPSTVSTVVGTLDVTFNEPINLNTFTDANLGLTYNNGVIPVSGATIALLSGSTYRISGLAPLTGLNGDYELTVSAAGVEDSMGDDGAGSESTSWTMDSTDTNVTVLDVIPAVRNSPVTHIIVEFSNPIEQPTFTASGLSLTFDGGPDLITGGGGVTITDIVGGTYDVSLPTGLTSADGTYAFSIDAAGAGILDAGGNAVVGGDSTSWTMDTTAPTITGIQQPQTPRNTVVSTLTVTFSEPIDPKSFGPGSLSLTRTVAGVATGNLLDNRVAIAPDTDPLALPNTYLISGINWPQSIEGTYTFTIGDAAIKDLAGNGLASPDGVSWSLVLTAPAAPGRLAISPDLGPDPYDGGMSELTNSQTVTFSGAIDASTVEVRLEDVTTSTELGDAFLTGQTFSRTLHLPPGLNVLSAEAFDQAGNGSLISTYDVWVSIAPPAISTIAPITPNPTATPVDTETVVLDEAVKSFDHSALSLTLNGSPVALNSGVTVSLVGGTAATYRISGLAPFTTANGAYVLTVDATRIVDYADNAGLGTATVGWNEQQAIADVTIANTVDNATPQPGSLIHFTVTLTNAGPADATNVRVLDALPNGLTLVSAAGPGTYNTSTGLWSIPRILEGSGATLILTASVNLGTGGQTLQTVASITGLDQSDNATPTSATQGVTVEQKPIDVYVSSAYAGDAPGAAVTWSDGTTHYVGQDAFGTIQAGINAVAVAGTVNVAAGTYVEQLTIAQGLDLVGAGVSSTTIQAPSSLNGDEIEITGTLVVALSGFTVDGASTSTAIDVNGGNLSASGLAIVGYNVGVSVEQGGAATITGSSISASTTGILVGSGSSDTAALTATDDSFAGDNVGVKDNQSSGTIAATMDWWGSSTGPTSTGNAGGTGAKAIGGVNFSPWLGDANLGPVDYLVFQSTAGSAFVVTPNGSNTDLGVSLGGQSVGAIPGGGTLSFTGTGGTVTIDGESGPGSTNVFTIKDTSVQLNAADALAGTTINLLGTGMTRYVDAEGTTNTFNILGAGAGGPSGSLVGDSGTNALVFGPTGKLLGGIQGAGSGTLNY